MVSQKSNQNYRIPRSEPEEKQGTRKRENDSVIKREGDKSNVIKRENEHDKKELERQCDKERGK